MPRARNIKPAFFKNDALVESPFETRLLFIGLWTLADKSGRLEDRPKRIKMEIFPADDVDVDKCLDQLDGEFISRYSVDGLRIIQVRNFEKHQNPHHKEKESELPGANLGQAQGKPKTSPGETLLIPDTGSLIPDSRNLIPEKVFSEQIEKVVGHYKTKRPNSRPGKKERAKIKERLGEGRTVTELTNAIDGCFASKWHVENSHIGLELICRDSTKVEFFIEKGKGKNVRENAAETW